LHGILLGSSLDVVLVKDIERRNNKNKNHCKLLARFELAFWEDSFTGKKIKIPRDNQLHERSDLDVGGACAGLWRGWRVYTPYTTTGCSCVDLPAVFRNKWVESRGKVYRERERKLDTGRISTPQKENNQKDNELEETKTKEKKISAPSRVRTWDLRRLRRLSRGR
jgi:hypothetical protein